MMDVALRMMDDRVLDGGCWMMFMIMVMATIMTTTTMALLFDHARNLEPSASIFQPPHQTHTEKYSSKGHLVTVPTVRSIVLDNPK